MFLGPGAGLGSEAAPRGRGLGGAGGGLRGTCACRWPGRSACWSICGWRSAPGRGGEYTSPWERWWLRCSCGVVIGATLVSRWSFEQITLTTGADQVWVFDGKYYGVLIALLVVWGLLFSNLVRGAGSRRVASSVTFQLCALSALGIFILPTTVLIPGFHHTLTYIAERMSLGVGICVCGLLGAAHPRAWERYALTAVAAVFFVFIYRDERALNSVEDRMQDAVAQLSPGQRVVSGVIDPDLRVPTLDHMIDRVCVGRCFSYANYEPLHVAVPRARARAESAGDRQLPGFLAHADGRLRGQGIRCAALPGVREPAGNHADSQFRGGKAMWKHFVEGAAGSISERLGWRRILAEGALLAAMLLTSSWLFRR